MARGWESKSVEAQQSEAAITGASPRKRQLSAEELQREQKKSELMLSRTRVTQQLEAATSERYAEMLRLALADIDRQIAALSN
jgi:hypothetical protein